MEEADGALSVSPHRTQTRVYSSTNGKWPDLTLFHRLSSSSDSLLPRNLLRKEGNIVRALSVYWHHRTYRIAIETNLITPVFRVRWVHSCHHTALLHCSRYAHILRFSTPQKKTTAHLSFLTHTPNGRNHFALRKTKSFVRVQTLPPQYKNCRRVATVAVVVALRGRRQERSVTFATYLSLPRV